MAALAALACAPESDKYEVMHYTCNFEGEYWDAKVDSDPNGNNLLKVQLRVSGKIQKFYKNVKEKYRSAVWR